MFSGSVATAIGQERSSAFRGEPTAKES